MDENIVTKLILWLKNDLFKYVFFEWEKVADGENMDGNHVTNGQFLYESEDRTE